jgi:hypothetical protein
MRDESIYSQEKNTTSRPREGSTSGQFVQTIRSPILQLGLVRLAGCQPASSTFLSHHFSTSHQPPASQQYFSLITNQHRPSASQQYFTRRIIVSPWAWGRIARQRLLCLCGLRSATSIMPNCRWVHKRWAAMIHQPRLRFSKLNRLRPTGRSRSHGEKDGA